MMLKGKLSSWSTTRNTIGVVIVAIVTRFCIRAAFTAKSGEHYISYPKNEGVGGPCETIFYPTNDGVKLKQPYTPQDQEFMSGLKALQDIVAKASSDGMKLRPIGTRWNMNNLPYSTEYMVDTRELTYVKVGIDDSTSHVMPDYHDIAERLTFVQAGVVVRELYKVLFEEGLTMPTTAVTDGMSMAGAISTGTHNAGIDFGGMQDFVKGLQLVLDGRTVFLQPETDKVITEAYAMAMGSDTLMSNDALFYNALVSYGAYGIIHGMLIEPVELYQLDLTVNNLSLEQTAEALPLLDFEALGFDREDNSVLPHHLDAYCNPYRGGPSACIVRIAEKRELSEKELAEVKATSATYQPKYMGKDPGTAMGEVMAQGLFSYIGLLRFGPIGNFLKRLVYGMAAQSSVITLVSYGGMTNTKGYPMEIYGDSAPPADYVNLPVPSIAMELAMSLESYATILPLIIKLLDENPAPVGLILRFAKGSKATMAPNQYEETAYIELGGIQWLDTIILYDKVIEALENRRNELDFNYHLSKENPEDDDFMRAGFGKAWEQFIVGRAGFLTEGEQYMFSNDYTKLLGITE